jgi:DegV family protein with EDD domain
MAVHYLDGVRLRRSTRAAARWVSQRQENLNGINVFPVPDGDTGTNMAATLVSAVEQAQRVRSRSIGKVSRALADGALFGACGNSGAIVAQFFEGFAAALDGWERANGQGLARAVANANQAAQQALEKPREGTILTVMRAWADRFSADSATDGADLLQVFGGALTVAREALSETPKQLKVLARAGVVDAGAQGFVYFLEGINHFAEGRLAGTVIEEGDHAAPLERASVVENPEEITYRYCTECLVEGRGLDLATVRAAIGRFGDSLVVAGSPHRLRVHVHSDDPDAVFGAVAEFGEIVSTKADDMRIQHVEQFGRERVAVVTDTAADLPERDQQHLRIHVVPLRVLLGSAAYLDKQTLNPDEVYERLRRGEQTVGTSQPPPGDYAALYKYLFEHYTSIVVVSLSAALSGTMNAARKGSELVGDGRVTVVDTGTASVAQGLIVQAAAECALDGGSVEDVVAAAEDARDRVRMWVGFPTLEFLARGGRVGGWKIRVAERLGLVPVITVPIERGAPKVIGVARRGRIHLNILDRARKTLKRESPRPDRIWIAHAGAPGVADAYRSELMELAPESEFDIVEVGPVLGVHAGPGAVAVGYLRAPS